VRSPVCGSVVLLVALALGGFSAAPARARDDEQQAAVRAAFAELASSDDAARKKAAELLAQWPWISGPELGRHGAALDGRAWSAVCDAFQQRADEGYWPAAYLVSGARTAPAAQRARMLALAHQLDPAAGVEHTPEEIEAVLHQVLVEWANARCSSGFELKIAVLGHQAVQPLLDRMKKGDPEHPGDSISCSALAMIAEREDVPAIRELLLAGKTGLADTLRSMQADGIREATDALLDALAAGRVNSRVMWALTEAPDPGRVVDVATRWIAGQDRVEEGARAVLACLFEKLDARTTAPTLEAWSRTSRSEGALKAIADALVRFGSRRGVELLVHVVSERRTRFPCRPSTPAEIAAATSPGRLCPDGFATYDRSDAAETLSAIAGPKVFDLPQDWSRNLARQGPGRESTDDYLDRAAAAFRTWWASVRDTLRRDPATGRWVSGG